MPPFQYHAHALTEQPSSSHDPTSASLSRRRFLGTSLAALALPGTLRAAVPNPQPAAVIDGFSHYLIGNDAWVRWDRRALLAYRTHPAQKYPDLEWEAVVPVTIGKSNHSLFSMRAARDLTPVGGGRLVDADGRSGEKATNGTPSAWCCFYGSRAGLPKEMVEGICLMELRA